MGKLKISLLSASCLFLWIFSFFYQFKVNAEPVIMADESELVELARSLQNDPKLIFEYVRNHVEYEPYFGYKKGPVATLIEMGGNDFDQAGLLIQLLRISGFEANFVYGEAKIPLNLGGDELSASTWLHVNAFDEVSGVLSSAGVPHLLESGWVILKRVWVQVDVGGVIYKLDPAYKAYERKHSLDFRQAMRLIPGEILNLSGGVQTTDYVQGLNDIAVRAKLTEYTTNLVDHLNSNTPNARLEDILGSIKIIPEYYQQLPISLDYVPSGSPTVVWEEVPQQLYTCLT